MTSTLTNRTAIAAALLGLLATIAGTQGTHDLECVCSPRKYRVAFDLAQDCANTDDISGLPGIQDFRFDLQNCNSDLIEVTQVQIDEEGLNRIKRSTYDFDPPVTSGTVEYTSASNDLLPGVPLANQVDIIPSEMYVYLSGNDANGNPISLVSTSSIFIVYTNECGSGPIVFDDSGLGNFNLVSTISIYFVSTTHYPLE